MEPTNGSPDVLGKIDALLTRHRTGAPTQQDLAAAAEQASRAAIPVLTEVIAGDSSIPVLTDAVTAVRTHEPEAPEPAAEAAESAQPDEPGMQTRDPLHDENTLRQMEDFMVQELENRIALEFTATLDRALNELLEHSREHIRHTVREVLRQQLGQPSSDTDATPDQP